MYRLNVIYTMNGSTIASTAALDNGSSKLALAAVAETPPTVTMFIPPCTVISSPL